MHQGQELMHTLCPKSNVSNVSVTSVFMASIFSFKEEIVSFIVPYLKEHIYKGYTIDIYTKQHIIVKGDLKLVFRRV